MDLLTFAFGALFALVFLRVSAHAGIPALQNRDDAPAQSDHSRLGELTEPDASDDQIVKLRS